MPGERSFQHCRLARESEIQDLGLKVGPDQDVARLQVAVDDLMLMQVMDGRDHLVHQLCLLSQRERTRRIGEERTLDVLHYEVRRLVGLPEIVDMYDVGVAEPGQSTEPPA